MHRKYGTCGKKLIVKKESEDSATGYFVYDPVADEFRTSDNSWDIDWHNAHLFSALQDARDIVHKRPKAIIIAGKIRHEYGQIMDLETSL